MDIGSEYRASELTSALLYSQIKKVKPKAVGNEKTRETIVEHTVTIIEFSR